MATSRQRAAPRIEKEFAMAPTSSKEGATSRSEAVVFWTWISVLAVGLAYMIAIPLSGR